MKRNTLLTICLSVVLVLSACYIAFGNMDSPGSEGDPLVSKSYVDQKTTFKVISMSAGQKLIGSEGTELIVRGGEALAIDNGVDGISDLTYGTDLLTGMQVACNHLVLVPRSDGRGISAVTDIWVMVKGDYTVQ